MTKKSSTPYSDISYTATPIEHQLEQLFSQIPEHDLICEYNEQWPSPCIEKINDDQCHWKPTLQPTQPCAETACGTRLFQKLEEALGFNIHPDIIAYYSYAWSNNINGFCSDTLTPYLKSTQVSLIFPWSPQDLDALRENFIGHHLQQKKRKLKTTFFIACPIQDDKFMISIDNNDGAVVLEQPGKKPTAVLSTSLEEFLKTLSPA